MATLRVSWVDRNGAPQSEDFKKDADAQKFIQLQEALGCTEIRLSVPVKPRNFGGRNVRRYSD